jgi:hypothetical protein
MGRPLGATALAIRDAVDDLTERYDRMTVRQVFYQLEMQGVVAKTEGGYRQVQREVLRMRRQNLLAWEFITDGTRWQRKPDSYRDAGSYVEMMARTYRRDLWQGQDARIEVWLEKDALADVVTDVTDKWDVSLMVSRGQSSETYLRNGAMAARKAYQNAGAGSYIYTLYDHDVGGDRSSNAIRRKLPEFASEVPIHVEPLALTEQQIEDWSLPTRPPKKKDPQAKKWGNRPTVELDAIDPDMLVSIVERAITRHVDPHAWAVEQLAEQEEQNGLQALVEAWS